MIDIRLCDSTFWWRSRHSYSSLLLAILGAYAFLLAGCASDQGESIRSKKDMHDEIVQIKRENEKLKYEVARAKEALAAKEAVEAKEALAAKEAPSAKEAYAEKGPYAENGLYGEKETGAEVLNAKNEQNIQSPGESELANQHIGPSVEEEFGALVQGTTELDEPLESATVEQVPENMVIAEVQPSGPVEEQLARISEEEFAAAVAGLEDIYFDFDSWKITEAGKDVLQKNAHLLQEDTNLTLLIEGHCDQRGTHAYNIILGEKRAVAIRDYLVHLGVEPRRLFVITYGKEKPFCRAHTEACYQENRRGHLLVRHIGNSDQGVEP